MKPPRWEIQMREGQPSVLVYFNLERTKAAHMEMPVEAYTDRARLAELLRALRIAIPIAEARKETKH